MHWLLRSYRNCVYCSVRDSSKKKVPILDWLRSWVVQSKPLASLCQDLFEYPRLQNCKEIRARSRGDSDATSSNVPDTHLPKHSCKYKPFVLSTNGDGRERHMHRHPPRVIRSGLSRLRYLLNHWISAVVHWRLSLKLINKRTLSQLLSMISSVHMYLSLKMTRGVQTSCMKNTRVSTPWPPAMWHRNFTFHTCWLRYGPRLRSRRYNNYRRKTATIYECPYRSCLSYPYSKSRHTKYCSATKFLFSVRL